MIYFKTVQLRDGRTCILRNGTAADGKAVYDVFNLTHEQTDWMLSYPDENSYDAEQEAVFLQAKTDSPDEIEILAEIDGRVVGTAGIEAVGKKYKVRHRAELGIGILREYWGLGIGRALTEACIQCARDAGYEQLELNVVADNVRAISMYRASGFEEFGRNPRGFKSRISGFQELVYMLMILNSD